MILPVYIDFGAPCHMSIISEQQAFLTGHNLSYTAVYFDQVMLAARTYQMQK